MARPPKDHDAAADLGRRLTALNEANGKPTPKAIERWLIRELGFEITDETIRQAHRGTVDPHTCQQELLFGLRRYYGVSAKDLGPIAARRMFTLIQTVEPETPGETSPLIHVSQSEGQLALAV